MGPGAHVGMDDGGAAWTELPPISCVNGQLAAASQPGQVGSWLVSTAWRLRLPLGVKDAREDRVHLGSLCPSGALTCGEQGHL